MKVAWLMMLLVGLMIPMTIASKSASFDQYFTESSNHEIADILEVYKLVQPKKIKSMNIKEDAEGSRKRCCAGSKVDIYISAYPPSRIAVDTLFEYGIDLKARYKMDSVNRLDESDLKSHAIELITYSSLGIINNFEVTNYIRYL
jgi:hypothetical protein